MAAKFATESGDNPLWQYALATYGIPGVKEVVLTMQNEFAVDVVMLLADQWRQQQQLSWPDDSQLQDYLAWRDAIIVPLRAARQLLSRDSEPLRSQLLKAELSAEQEAIRRLYRVLNNTAESHEPVDVLDTSAAFYDQIAGQKKEALRPLFQQFINLISD